MAWLVFDLDRRKFHLFDWTTFFIVVALSVIGLCFVFSATQSLATPGHCSTFFLKQLFGVSTGVLLFWLAFVLDYRTLQRWGTVAYYLTLVLLTVTLVKGSVGMGAQRWVSLGFVKFQPSELAKLFFPAFFTTTLLARRDKDDDEGPGVSTFAYIVGVLMISAFLVLKQPDLGTALLLFFSGIILLWLANVGRAFFLLLLLFTASIAPVAWNHLKPYQKKRIEVFLGGGGTRRERYQIEQSRIAVGSGGFFGKGYLQGTQSRLRFLPESRTDFIFAVVCEEKGFFGAITVILLFSILFLRLLIRIASIPSFSAQLLAIGLMIPLALSAVINISMVLGLLPVVGIPLPFLSYGITHIWIDFISLGWCTNIIARHALVP